MALDVKKRPSKKTAEADTEVKVSKKQQAAIDKPFVAELPLVNLLSGEVQEVVEQQRLKRLFAGLGLGLVGAIAALFLAQQGLIAVAETKLEEEQTRAAALAAQQAELAPVADFYAQIEANKSTIQTTMANEVLASQVISDLNRTTPAGMNVSNVSVSLETSAAPAAGVTDPTATSGACPSQDPYNEGGLSAGCVTVDGDAASRAVLGDWLDMIEESETFTVAFIPTTSAGGETGGVTFSATIGLSDSVYQNRYSDPEFLKAGTN